MKQVYVSSFITDSYDYCKHFPEYTGNYDNETCYKKRKNTQTMTNQTRLSHSF